MTIQLILAFIFALSAILSFLPYLLGFDNKDDMREVFSAIWTFSIVLCHSIFATDMACRYGTNIPTEELIFTGSVLDYAGGVFFVLHILMGVFPTTQTRRYLRELPKAIAMTPVILLWEVPKVLVECFVLPPLRRVQEYMTK